MNFREEYKKSADYINPSAEALQRMKSNVLEKIKTPAKKVFPWKNISVIGGSVAACAVLCVAAVRFIPQSMKSTDMTANSMSSVAMNESAAADCVQNTDGYDISAGFGDAGSFTDNVKENGNINTDISDSTNVKTADEDHSEYSISESAPEAAVPPSSPNADISTESETACEAAGDAVQSTYIKIDFSEDMSLCTFENTTYKLLEKGEYYDNQNTTIEGIICEGVSDGTLYLVEFTENNLYISELGNDFIGIYIKAE